MQRGMVGIELKQTLSTIPHSDKKILRKRI